MSELICTIFNVEHGFCAFVRSPNKYGLLIDCHSRANFSPIKWIRKTYHIDSSDNPKIKYYKGKRFALCIVTHMHSDHFHDVGSFDKKQDGPKQLRKDDKTLKFIDEMIDEMIKDGAKGAEGRRKLQALRKFKKFCAAYTEDDTTVDWGFELSTHQLSYSDADDVSDGSSHLINNRSYVIAIEFAGKKILIPGDIEAEGWEKALENENFQKLVAGTDFFVASHHGHKSGFTKKVLEHSGKPDIFIVSAGQGGAQIDKSYSKSENSNGYLIDGDIVKSHSVSTCGRGKSIEITVRDDGTSRIRLLEAKDNLSAN